MSFSQKLPSNIQSLVDEIPAPGTWPDPRELPSGLHRVQSFNAAAMLPPSIAPWVEDIAERMQCPPDFVGIPAMVALGSVIGRKIGIRPQRKTDWVEVPNLWGFIIGRPGVLKSPALNEALRPLQRLEAQARKDNESKLKVYENALEIHKIKQKAAEKAAMKAATKGDEPTLSLLETPQPPPARRFIVNDCTYEALGEILSANPNGVLVCRDEIVSLLKTLDQEEYATTRGFFLQAWSGTSGYTFDRIIRGHTYIEAACISLLGSTQPAKISEYIRKAIRGQGDDGLIQRFGMMAWPDHSAEWKNTDRYPDTTARNSAWSTFEALDKLMPDAAGAQRDEFHPIPFLRFDSAAQELFEHTRTNIEKSVRSGQLHPAYESHIAKYRTLIPALALISSLADGMTGVVDRIATERALNFIDYLLDHANRIYNASSEAEALAAKAILSRIRKGDLKDGFSARQIRRHEWSNLTDQEQITAGLDLLVDYDWLAEKLISTPGRPRRVYFINPKARQ
jgi:hypothetical protein